MAFEDNSRELYDRAERIESMEGTIKYAYSEAADDAKEYTGSSLRRALLIDGVMVALIAVVLVVGIVIHEVYMTMIAASLEIFMALVTIMVVASTFRAAKGATRDLDEVKLSFNAYGFVMRLCSSMRCAVFAYTYADLDSLIEYSRIVVGIRSGIAYIFPKRVFSPDEFEKFRKFAYASLGKKCFFKNFRP